MAQADVPPIGDSGAYTLCHASDVAAQKGKTCSECAAAATSCSSPLTQQGYTVECSRTEFPDSGGFYAVDVFCKSDKTGCSTATASALPLVGCALLLGLWAFARVTARRPPTRPR